MEKTYLQTLQDINEKLSSGIEEIKSKLEMLKLCEN